MSKPYAVNNADPDLFQMRVERVQAVRAALKAAHAIDWLTGKCSCGKNIRTEYEGVAAEHQMEVQLDAALEVLLPGLLANAWDEGATEALQKTGEHGFVATKILASNPYRAELPHS